MVPEVEQVDRRRQPRDGAVQQRRRDVAELPRVLKRKMRHSDDAPILQGVPSARRLELG